MALAWAYPPFKVTSSQPFFCLVSFTSLTLLNPGGALPLLVLTTYILGELTPAANYCPVDPTLLCGGSHRCGPPRYAGEKKVYHNVHFQLMHSSVNLCFKFSFHPHQLCFHHCPTTKELLASTCQTETWSSALTTVQRARLPRPSSSLKPLNIKSHFFPVSILLKAARGHLLRLGQWAGAKVSDCKKSTLSRTGCSRTLRLTIHAIFHLNSLILPFVKGPTWFFFCHLCKRRGRGADNW